MSRQQHQPCATNACRISSTNQLNCDARARPLTGTPLSAEKGCSVARRRWEETTCASVFHGADQRPGIRMVPGGRRVASARLARRRALPRRARSSMSHEPDPDPASALRMPVAGERRTFRQWIVLRAGRDRRWGGEIRRQMIFERLADRTAALVVESWPYVQGLHEGSILAVDAPAASQTVPGGDRAAA